MVSLVGFRVDRDSCISVKLLTKWWPNSSIHSLDMHHLKSSP